MSFFPGTTTFWSPNNPNPLVQMLCHKGAVRAVTINKAGTYVYGYFINYYTELDIFCDSII